MSSGGTMSFTSATTPTQQLYIIFMNPQNDLKTRIEALCSWIGRFSAIPAHTVRTTTDNVLDSFNKRLKMITIDNFDEWKISCKIWNVFFKSQSNLSTKQRWTQFFKPWYRSWMHSKTILHEHYFLDGSTNRIWMVLQIIAVIKFLSEDWANRSIWNTLKNQEQWFKNTRTEKKTARTTVHKCQRQAWLYAAIPTKTAQTNPAARTTNTFTKTNNSDTCTNTITHTRTSRIFFFWRPRPDTWY